MAEPLDLAHIGEGLAHYAAVRRDAFGYWTPAQRIQSGGASVRVN